MTLFRRLREFALILAPGLIGYFWGFLVTCEADDPKQVLRTSVLDINAPANTEVSLDGKPYPATKRRFTYESLEESKVYTVTVRARFADGTMTDRKVLIKGGWNPSITLQPPDQARPELVLPLFQTSDFEYRRSEFSRDGRFLLTHNEDGAQFWDATNGKFLRSYNAGGRISTAAFVGDEKRILTGGDEGVTLWDRETGRAFQRLDVGRSADFAISRDGTTLATVNWRKDEKDPDGEVWDLNSGRRLSQLRGGHRPNTDNTNRHVAISPDGRFVATTDYQERAVVLWDRSTFRMIKKVGLFLTTKDEFRFYQPNIEFSSDSQSLVVFDNDGEFLKGRGAMAVYSAPDGRQITRKDFPFEMKQATFLPGSREVAFVAEARDNASGSSLTIYTASVSNLEPKVVRPAHSPRISFGESGERYFDGSSIRSWANGEIVTSLSSAASATVVNSLWLADLKRLILCDVNGHVIRWNVETSLPEATYNFSTPKPPGESEWFTEFQLTNAEKWITSQITQPSSKQHQILVNDLNDGRSISRFTVPEFRKWSFSSSGTRVLIEETGTEKKIWSVWDVQSGKRLQTHQADSALLSPDGSSVILTSGVESSGPRIVDAISGQLIAKLTSKYTEPGPLFVTTPDGRTKVRDDHVVGSLVAISPDGQWVIQSNSLFNGNGGLLWNLRTRTLARALPPPCLFMDAFFSRDSRYLALIENGKVRLIDVTTGATIREGVPHSSHEAGTFSRDGRILQSAPGGGVCQLTDVATGEELATLIILSIPDSAANGTVEWLAVSPEGLFDGTESGRQHINFRVGRGLNVVPVDRFFQDFYRPGLLAGLVGGERLQPEVTLGKAQPPQVRIVSPKSGETLDANASMVVEFVDQGGGVGGVGLFQNGARVLAPGESSQDGKITRRTFELALVEGKNRIRVAATNADGSWEAESAEISLNYQRPITRSDLHLIAIGISKHADANLNLKYAADDARAMGDLFQKRAGKLYDKVHVTTVIDGDATRDGMKNALRQAAAQTRPQDTLIVFLAGHGTMVGQRYYFVPYDLRKETERLEDDLRKQALTAEEINDLMTPARALKRVLIFDTCASGGALPPQRGRSGVALRGAIERLTRSSGIFTIAAASATEEAQESQELKHGVLSYALLAGLKAVDGGPLEGRSIRPTNPEQTVDVLEWFTFASGHVPRLTEKLFGAAQDVLTSTQGQSFPVLPLEDK